MNIFQGISVPIPCRMRMKKIILNLSRGGCVSNFARSIVMCLKLSSSSGRLRPSHAGVSRTGSVDSFRPVRVEWDTELVPSIIKVSQQQKKQSKSFVDEYSLRSLKIIFSSIHSNLLRFPFVVIDNWGCVKSVKSSPHKELLTLSQRHRLLITRWLLCENWEYHTE